MTRQGAAILVLAAGSATRMGEPKQLLPWRGNTLVRHAVETALAVPESRPFLLTGAYDELVLAACSGLEVSVIHNPGYKKGLGSSIATCVREVHRTPGATFDRILIMLADQPAVTAAYLGELLDRSRSADAIVATNYPGRVGVPAVFPARWFPELARLEGDAGAGRMLHALDRQVLRQDPPFDLYDIDTPEDYHRHAGN